MEIEKQEESSLISRFLGGGGESYAYKSTWTLNIYI